MAVATILGFFILLIGAMFVSGGIMVSAGNLVILAIMLGLAGFTLYEMFKLISQDE